MHDLLARFFPTNSGAGNIDHPDGLRPTHAAGSLAATGHEHARLPRALGRKAGDECGPALASGGKQRMSALKSLPALRRSHRIRDLGHREDRS